MFNFAGDMTVLFTLLVYFALLLLFSRLTSGHSDNDAFFRANRQSPWYMVAFGMIGASISGVSFVSVPGMVLRQDMTYLQMCIGFIPGYFAVAFLLLPVYYRLRLTTIYAYLKTRLGRCSYKTGASFFLLSKMTGAAVRFYVVCMLLQYFVFQRWGIPFAFTVVGMTALIWLYTRKGGVKTLVWTDTFQTLCMFVALLLIIYKVTAFQGLGAGDAVSAIASDARSRIFVFDDLADRQYFWKQFLSGVFIVIVMTGLDQDMMQKNLTCKSLRDAQKDMCCYGFAFVPANLLLLALGILLARGAESAGIATGGMAGDELLPAFCASGALGQTGLILFTVGVVAASFSSADSALTALTTSWCVDICEKEGDERLRKRTHVGVCAVFALFILLFGALNSTSVIDAIYILCSYTYGPLLGLFAYGLLTNGKVNDCLVPYIAVVSPLICFLADRLAAALWDYHFGYELLMLNGALTFFLLQLTKKGGK